MTSLTTINAVFAFAVGLYALATFFDTLLSIHAIIKYGFAVEANRFMRPLFEKRMYWAIWLTDIVGVALLGGVTYYFCLYKLYIPAAVLLAIGTVPRVRVVIKNYLIYRRWKEHTSGSTEVL